MKRIYTVEAVRSGNWWALEVPDLPGAFSQARRLDHAAQTASDLIAFATKAPADSFEVQIVPRLPEDLEDALRQARQARTEAEAAQGRASALTKAAVRRLLDKGLSVRDIGALVGLTFQRVSQLAAEPKMIDRNQSRPGDDRLAAAG